MCDWLTSSCWTLSVCKTIYKPLFLVSFWYLQSNYDKVTLPIFLDYLAHESRNVTYHTKPVACKRALSHAKLCCIQMQNVSFLLKNLYIIYYESISERSFSFCSWINHHSAWSVENTGRLEVFQGARSTQACGQAALFISWILYFRP